MTDYTGIALLITAVGGVCTSVLQIVALFRGQQRDQKLATLHDMVDGQGTKLNEAIGQAGYAQGHADGKAEQNNQTTKP